MESRLHSIESVITRLAHENKLLRELITNKFDLADNNPPRQTTPTIESCEHATPTINHETPTINLATTFNHATPTTAKNAKTSSPTIPVPTLSEIESPTSTHPVPTAGKLPTQQSWAEVAKTNHPKPNNVQLAARIDQSKTLLAAGGLLISPNQSQHQYTFQVYNEAGSASS